MVVLTNNWKKRLCRQLGVVACVAFVVIGVLFPDIAFFQRTLQPSNIQPLLNKPANWQASSAVVPVFDSDVLPSDGFDDLSSARTQFEPAHYFIARAFRDGQSPWWNPYSAAGTLGPETLVDVKFSPHTLITVFFFDASPASFDFSLLAIYCVGFYFMLRICLDIFRTNLGMALLGATTYLLNGFAVPNLNTGIGQPYFLFPLVLFALLWFCQRRDLVSWLLVVFVHAAIMLANIMTTFMLTLIAVHALSMAFYFGCAGGVRQGCKEFPLYFMQIAAAVFFSIALLGFLWFPVVDSFFVSDMASDFAARKLPKPVGIENLLSIFTPEHFWDFFGHESRVDLYPQAALETRTSRFSYLGIIASLVAVCALGIKNPAQKMVAVVGAVLVVFSYARIFGLAGFVDYLPVLHSIGNQYWGLLASVVLTVLVVFGVQSIREGNIPILAVIVVLLLQAIGMLYLYKKLGLPESPKQLLHVGIATALWVSAVLFFMFLKMRWISSGILAVFITVALLLELFGYMNTARPMRYGIADTEPKVVQFLRKNIDDARLLNVGQRDVLFPEYGALFGIKQAGTMNAGLMPWYEQYFDRYFGNDTFFFLALDGSTTKKRKKTSRKEFLFDAAALNAASIKYILVSREADEQYRQNLLRAGYPIVYEDAGAQIFENADYLPSLSLVDALSTETVLHPRRVAITIDEMLLAAAKSVGVSVVKDSVDIESAEGVLQRVSSSNTEVLAKVSTSKPAVLVLSDVWHPAWRATVNGEPAYVGRVNEAFRGVVLPAGEHAVRFYYDLPTLRYGIRTSIVASIIFVMLLIRALTRRRAINERRTSHT